MDIEFNGVKSAVKSFNYSKFSGSLNCSVEDPTDFQVGTVGSVKLREDTGVLYYDFGDLKFSNEIVQYNEIDKRVNVQIFFEGVQ